MNNILFNDSWQFAEFPLGTDLTRMADSPKLAPVDVPHDWMIYDTKDLYRNSIGFYKKAFHVKAAKNHTYIIRFEGIYMNSEIFLNGTRIFEWKYGYSTFEVDLTGHIKDGDNVLFVKCTYEAPNSRWYSGAGIYRNVRFIDKGPSYLPTDGTYITAKKNGDDFIVTIDSEAVSRHPAEAVLRHRITDASGTEIASGESIVPLSRETIINKQSINVSNVRLWDISDPYVYKVTTELLIGGKVVDYIENPLGFRTIEFDENKGFFLNGRNVKINGACQHHDLGALGAAMNKTALRRQFEKLKAMGVNAIRTSHNMPAVEVMELADEMGLLIYSESFDMWELPKTPHDYGVFFPEWWQKDVTSWVKRDRNHPSLIIWGIGNEIYDTHAGNGLKWTKLLRDTVRELDPRHNAFISIGSNYIEWENAQKCSDELELSGYNYGERLYDEHHKKYPHWKIFGSETASTVQSRGIYHFPLSVRLLTHEDGQCSCLGNCSTNWGAKNVDFVVSEHRDRDFVFGQFIWTGWDYIGEPTPYSSKNSYFGQIDTAGFEKDTFYQYQAEWTDVSSPMVHLLPYWDFNEGQIIDVIAYSNAPYVELFFNGKSLGRQFIDHKHGKELKAHWQVPYSSGELKAVATDLDGITLATDTVRSFSDPVRLKAVPDKETLIANGEDLCFIGISSEDEAGTFVANARNRVKVSVSGPGRLVGLDNGDSTDYDQYKGDSRRLFSGRLLAIIASTGEPGDITVRFDSVGLESTELSLTSLESDGSYVACCSERNYASEESFEVPVRKIALALKGENSLSPENPSSEVAFKIYPSNATYKDVEFKAVTKDGVEANFAKVAVEKDTVKITAVGDGEFKLTAYAYNDKDHPEVVSELSFVATGLGMAVRDPYSPVPGCECTKTHMGETKLSFQGGVFLTDSDRAFATYENLDFGDFGSDEITIPLFSFNNEVPLEVWEGVPGEGGECLLKDVYKAKSIYNTYQDNTFKLSRRIKGIQTLTLLFDTTSRFSLKGFVFKKPEKAYALNLASEYSLITGDSFTVSKDSVTGIGNNVALEFEGMDFSEKGISAVEITGRSNNEKTTIHLLFTDDSETLRQMVEFEYSEDYKTVTVPLEDVRLNCKAGFLFLPGSNFDLKSFRFIPAVQ